MAYYNPTIRTDCNFHTAEFVTVEIQKSCIAQVSILEKKKPL